MKYKQYILFSFDFDYPAGGLGDIVNSFDTLEEAKCYAEKNRKDYNQVIDRDTWELVWESP